MNVSRLRRAALSVLALLPLTISAAAASSADFDSLLRSGFSDVRAAAARSQTPAPSARELPAAPFVGGGVFLQSSSDGRIAYCSASGCRLLLNEGAGVVVQAGPGALYFTGTSGTGYCTGRRCDVLAPNVRMTFPLTAGPKGEIYGTDDASGWHCTPDSCRRASAVPLQRGLNFIEGVYKPSGDFVSSSANGTFWCADGTCARVGDRELLFIDENCAGTAPAQAAYAFAGPDIYLCTSAACRRIGSGEAVDNYLDCGFDEEGRLLLPARQASDRPVTGAILCSENGVERTSESIPAAARKTWPGRSSDSFLTGEDGAGYRLANGGTETRSGPPAPRLLYGQVTRTDAAGRATALTFDAPVACWQWDEGDGDDEDVPAWRNNCHLLR